MNDNDFYIGWLPTPRRYATYLLRIVGIAVVGMTLAAAILAFYQRDPGPGQWDEGQVVTVRGLVANDPYAMLWVPEERADKASQVFMLVEDGKFGAQQRISRIAENSKSPVPVEVRGTILHRDDRWMLALEKGESSCRVLNDSEARSLSTTFHIAPSTSSVRVTLVGEVIDPKCYLGAMKPGGGKTHKACAMRCISGGIPPMLVTRDAAMRETYYLLVDEMGSVANEIVYPFVGDQIEVVGQLEELTGIRKLYVDPKTIHRL